MSRGRVEILLALTFYFWSLNASKKEVETLKRIQSMGRQRRDLREEKAR